MLPITLWVENSSGTVGSGTQNDQNDKLS